MPTSQSLTLHPVKASIPGEILAMIADACVEPYYIIVEINPSNPSSQPPVSARVYRSRSTNNFASVSRGFQSGICQGLRKCFDGHIRLSDLCVTDIESILKQNGLDWIFQKVTSITVTRSHQYIPMPTYPARLSPVASNPYVNFLNLKHLDIACAILAIGIDDPVTVLFRDEDDAIARSAGAQFARFLLRHFRPPNWAMSGLVVKTIFEVMRDTPEYINEEVRFTGMDYQKSIRYQTPTLDWKIRIREESNDTANGEIEEDEGMEDDEEDDQDGIKAVDDGDE